MTKYSIPHDADLGAVPNAARWAFRQTRNALCAMRKVNPGAFDQWMNFPFPPNSLYNYESVCEMSDEPPPPPPRQPDAGAYAAGMRCMVETDFVWPTGCSATGPQVFYTNDPNRAGKPVGPGAASTSCEGKPHRPTSDFHSTPLFCYNGTTFDNWRIVWGMPPGTTPNFLVGSTTNVWKPINPDNTVGGDGSGGGSVPPSGFIYRPPTDPSGTPNTDGDKWDFRVPIVFINGSANFKLADNVNIRVDVGGVEVNMGGGEDGSGDKGSGGNPSPDDDVVPEPENDEDKDPEEQIVGFIVTVTSAPANAKRQSIEGTANDLIWSGWYSLTVNNVESERLPLDRAKVYIPAYEGVSGIHVGSYAGFTHQVDRRVRKKVALDFSE